MLIGICKLCLESKLLQESHFMPRALYPKQRKPRYATRHNSGPLDSKEKQIKSHLLCFDLSDYGAIWRMQTKPVSIA
jgi:hypothetical protein